MTDDFQLFPDATDGDVAVDADTAIIMAYLAHELTDVQVAGVEERLATDALFRESVRPIIDTWFLPGSFASNAGSRAEKITTRTRVPLARIAALVALTVVPAFAFAQLVKYIAGHPGAPGHAFVQSFVPVAWRAPEEPPLRTALEAEGDLAWFFDAPVQQRLPLTREQRSQPASVVDLPAASVRATRTFGAILGIKQTDSGRVLVNDALRQQLLLFESDLSTSIAVLDSVPGTSRSYTNQPGVVPSADVPEHWRILRPFRGDSAVFGPVYYRNGVATFVVLDERGNPVRAITLNTLPGVVNWGSAPSAVHFDTRERAVSQGQVTRTFMGTFVGTIGGFWKAFGSQTRASTISSRSDTLRIIRLERIGATQVDTLAFVNLPENGRPRIAGPASLGVGNGGGKLVPVTGPDGAVCRYTSTSGVPFSGVVTPPGCVNSAKQVVNPLYFVDDWTMLSDGSIAIVRGQDYRVDWIRPDGTRTSSEKLAFEWKPLTDADKQRLVDSTRATIDSLDALAEKLEEGLVAWKDSVTIAARAAGARLVNDELAHPGPPVRIWPYEIVPLSQIADHYPPIRPAASKADADGNLWVLPVTTSLSKQGELVYDVVNPSRGLVQRVRLPVGRSIAGFGKGGVVYLQSGDLKTGFVLERTKLPGPIPK